MPTTRPAFWRRKLDLNRRRDVKQARRLMKLGWSALTVWECQLAGEKMAATVRRMRRFLGPPRCKRTLGRTPPS